MSSKEISEALAAQLMPMLEPLSALQLHFLEQSPYHISTLLRSQLSSLHPR